LNQEIIKRKYPTLAEEMDNSKYYVSSVQCLKCEEDGIIDKKDK